MKNTDSTYGLDTSVYEALKKAIQSRNSNSVYEFVIFFRKVITSSIREGKVKYFKYFITFPSRIYQLILRYEKNNTVPDDLTATIVNDLGLHLREIIMFYIPMTRGKVIDEHSTSL